MKLIMLITLMFSSVTITIINPNIDLGRVKPNVKTVIYFKIKNNTNTDIKILSVSSTCGCTIPDYPNTLRALNVTTVKAIFDNKGLIGSFKKELVLVTNDSTKFYTLRFFGTIVK